MTSLLRHTSRATRALTGISRATNIAGQAAAASRAALQTVVLSSRVTPSIQPRAGLQASAAGCSVAAAPSASTSDAASSLTDATSLFPGAAIQHLSLQLDSTLHALHVRMQRPQLHNAFNEHLIAELRRVFDAVATASNADSKVTSPLASLRAVVLTGAGASFSAGADLNWMQKMRTYTKDENLADAKLLFAMVASISSCPVPVIARVNGAALGGGVGLVAACDIALAVNSAKFGLTEVKLGLSPAVISSFVMSKITPSAASYYCLTGARFDAEEARRIGLLHEVVADEGALDAAIKRTLEELALNSPKAVRATKALLNHIRRDPRIAESEPYVTSLIAGLRVSEEGQEGLDSFFDKRKAAWIPAHLGNPKPKTAGEKGAKGDKK
jgi:methylglutaconyl-CoA hydratase